MKIGKYRPPERNEIAGLPKGTEWIDSVLTPRDKALKDHAQALQKRLTIGDNHNAEVRDIEVFHNEEVSLRLTELSGPPIGVILLHSDLYDFAKLRWYQSDSSTIKFVVYFDSSPVDAQTVRLLILGS